MGLKKIVANLEKDRNVVNKIEDGCKKYMSLNDFTKIELDFTYNSKESDENIFQKLLKAKVEAQSCLNDSYNKSFYEKCLLLAIYQMNDRVYQDNVSVTILRYVVLYQHLLRRQDLQKNDTISDQQRIQCTYCDYYNSADRTLCDYCEGELNRNLKQDYIGRENFGNKVFKENNVKLIHSPNNRNKYVRVQQEGSVENGRRCELCRLINDFENVLCERCLVDKEKCNTTINKTNIGLQSHSKMNGDNISDDDKDERCEVKSSYDNLQKSIKSKGNTSNNSKIDDSLLSEGKDEYLNKGRIDCENTVKSAKVWTCTYCTFNNVSNNQTCQACFKDKLENTKKLENKNKHENIKMSKIICDKVKEENKKIIFNDQRESSILKDEDETMREKNEVKRKTEDNFKEDVNQRLGYAGQIKNVWVCSVCTFINKSVNERCETCGKKEVCEGGSTDSNEGNNKYINKNIKDKNNNFKVQNLTYEKQDYVTQNCKAHVSLRKERFDKGVSENTSLKNTTSKSLPVECVSLESKKRGVSIDHNSASSSKGIWDCPSCTFKNKLEDKCCEVCYTIREVEASSAEEDMTKGGTETAGVIEGSWKCMDCKKDNSFDRYTCGSCRKYAPFFNKWVCEKCSFFNDEMRLYCEICNVKNVHLKMCNKCQKVIKVEDGALCYDCGDRRTRSKESLEDNGWIIVKGKNSSKEKPKGDNIPNKCMDNKYYCNNRWCGAINNCQSEHCSKCKLKKEANITFLNVVEVFNVNKYVKMWQCTFCGDFNSKRTCGKCKNMRDDPSYKRCCQCNWVNKVIDKKCNKCFKVL